jgi:hypothetical protein
MKREQERDRDSARERETDEERERERERERAREQCCLDIHLCQQSKVAHHGYVKFISFYYLHNSPYTYSPFTSILPPSHTVTRARTLSLSRESALRALFISLNIQVAFQYIFTVTGHCW